jgi:hypothetical protein
LGHTHAFTLGERALVIAAQGRRGENHGARVASTAQTALPIERNLYIGEQRFCRLNWNWKRVPFARLCGLNLQLVESETLLMERPKQLNELGFLTKRLLAAESPKKAHGMQMGLELLGDYFL